jgi:hypothetical protein
MCWIPGQVAGWKLKGGGEEGEKLIARRGSFPVVERLLRFRYKSGLCLGSVALSDDPGLGTTAKVGCHPGKRLQRHRGDRTHTFDNKFMEFSTVSVAIPQEGG